MGLVRYIQLYREAKEAAERDWGWGGTRAEEAHLGCCKVAAHLCQISCRQHWAGMRVVTAPKQVFRTQALRCKGTLWLYQQDL